MLVLSATLLRFAGFYQGHKYVVDSNIQWAHQNTHSIKISRLIVNRRIVIFN